MASPFFRGVADKINREHLAASKLEGNMVEADIKARQHDANVARIWASNRAAIKAELLAQWA